MVEVPSRLPNVTIAAAVLLVINDEAVPGATVANENTVLDKYCPAVAVSSLLPKTTTTTDVFPVEKK